MNSLRGVKKSIQSYIIGKLNEASGIPIAALRLCSLFCIVQLHSFDTEDDNFIWICKYLS